MKRKGVLLNFCAHFPCSLGLTSLVPCTTFFGLEHIPWLGPNSLVWITFFELKYKHWLKLSDFWLLHLPVPTFAWKLTHGRELEAYLKSIEADLRAYPVTENIWHYRRQHSALEVEPLCKPFF